MNNGIEVIDRQYNFSIIENALIEDPDVSIYGLAVYAALKYFSGRKAGEYGKPCCWPSLETIAEKSKCSRASVIRALKDLEDMGYISRQRRSDGKMKMTTVYMINGVKKDSLESLKKCLTDTTLVSDRAEGSVCESHRTRSIELDPMNQNTPLSPQGESTADLQQQSAIPFEEQQLSREITALIKGEFAVSNSVAALEEAVQRWIAAYGGERTRSEIKAAILWNVEHGHKRKSAVAFLGGWLRRNRGKTTLADENTLSLFEEFWAHWPGVGDGKEGARQEFCRRFAALPGREAKNKGLKLLSVQLQSLIDRAEEGQDPVFLGKAKNFLRDADLTG